MNKIKVILVVRFVSWIGLVAFFDEGGGIAYGAVTRFLRSENVWENFDFEGNGCRFESIQRWKWDLIVKYRCGRGTMDDDVDRLWLLALLVVICRLQRLSWSRVVEKEADANRWFVKKPFFLEKAARIWELTPRGWWLIRFIHFEVLRSLPQCKRMFLTPARAMQANRLVFQNNRENRYRCGFSKWIPGKQWLKLMLFTWNFSLRSIAMFIIVCSGRANKLFRRKGNISLAIETQWWITAGIEGLSQNPKTIRVTPHTLDESENNRNILAEKLILGWNRNVDISCCWTGEQTNETNARCCKRLDCSTVICACLMFTATGGTWCRS